MHTNVLADLLVADEVWIATALLHREHPERKDFEIGEIVHRADQENLHGSLRPGVRVHATLHAVANRPPNPGRHRMLYATGKHTRRLCRPADPCHPQRTGKLLPERNQIPERYHYLLDWYESEYVTAEVPETDPVLALQGAGQVLRADGEHPDEWVQRLREGWS